MHDSSLAPLFKQHIDVVTQRYQKAMQNHDFDHLVIPAGSQHGIFLDDMSYPFKSNFHFNSFVPLNDLHDSVLIISADGTRKLCYYQPVDFWHYVAGDPEGFWVDHFDIVMTRTKDEVLSHIPTTGNVAYIGEMGRPFDEDNFSAVNPGYFMNEINWHRAIKSDYEVECVSRANKCASMGHMAARDMFFKNGSELEIHLAYLLATGHAEHQLPYGSIVALNEHAAILHYTLYNNQAPKQHRTFLIDAGARYNSYAADVTRTYAYENNEFAELIGDMDALEQRICSKLTIGQSYVDLHIESHLEIAKLLNKYKFSDMSPESMVESGVTSTFFPHGLGHHIGLQVHDVGGHQANVQGDPAPPPKAHPFLRNTRDIEVGNILTIEPGLYFIDSLLGDLKQTEHAKSINWDKIEQFKPFGGIRIEDEVLVTATGPRNLTREHLD